MQDWIVRKQLSGTEGIAEVSGWGGYVKQYDMRWRLTPTD